ncbi:tail sheath stabilizer [Vibrio phage D479]
MLGGYFYHKSLRKYTLLLGNLFSNIYVSRGENYQRVPITVTSKERFVAALNSREYSDDKVARVATILPRIGIQMTSMTYDATRKTNVSNRRNVSDLSAGRPQLNTLFNPVPYDIEFDVTVYTRHQDDAYQIIEQIVPYFQPAFNTMIKELDENEVVIDQRDIPILLESVTPDEDLEGAANESRHIEWNLSLRLKGWLYPPTNAQFGEIRTIYLNFEDEEQVIIAADREAVTSSITMQWNTQRKMFAPSTLEFDWRYSTDASTMEVDWTTRNFTDNSFRLDYMVRQDSIQSDYETSYSVRTTSVSDIELQWKVFNISTIGTMELEWQVRTDSLIGTMELDWNTRSYATSTFGADWTVFNRINSSNLEFDWKVTQFASTDVELEWQTRSGAETDLEVDWSVRDSIAVPYGNNWVVE